MTKLPHEEIAHELMADFYQDFSEAHQKCEHTLIELEQRSDDSGLLNDLFRSIHTIKGNLVYVGLKDLTPLIQSVEDILDAIRKGTVHYDTLLSDVILLTLDKTQSLVEACVNHWDAPISENEINHLCQVISRVAEVDNSRRELAIRQALTSMDPDILLPDIVVAPGTLPLPEVTAPKDPIAPPDADLQTLLGFYGVEVDADMQLFISINDPIESRSLYWKGRTLRLLRLALAMNRHAGEPIAPSQLAAAVILHDVGMAFMPVDLLHKNGVLTLEELRLLQTHPQHACTLLSTMQRWATAAACVLQHHERTDGKGYPANMAGDAIAEGAKILSIVDTFEARTHERAYSSQTKRPFIRAVLEINSCADSQFDAKWVQVFNEVARDLKAHGRR